MTQRPTAEQLAEIRKRLEAFKYWKLKEPAQWDEGPGPDIETLLAELDAVRARVKELEDALEKVLIKVDWNSDEFHNAKQYAETRQILLNALAPKEQRHD